MTLVAMIAAVLLGAPLQLIPAEAAQATATPAPFEDGAGVDAPSDDSSVPLETGDADDDGRGGHPADGSDESGDRDDSDAGDEGRATSPPTEPRMTSGEGVAPRDVSADPVAVELDPGLRTAINRQRGRPSDEPVTMDDLATLARLMIADFMGDEVHSLAGLEHAVALESLSIERQPIDDLTPLAPLSRLATLSLVDLPVSDLSPIADSAIEYLTLRSLTATSLEYIDTMPQLTSLVVTDMVIDDWSPISRAAHLTEVDVSRTNFDDLDLLLPLRELLSMRISKTGIVDITALPAWTGLQYLDMNDLAGDIPDLDPLVPLTGLVHLSANGNAIGDIDGIAGATRMQWLSLRDNEIADISALSDLSLLTDLDLSMNRVHEVSSVLDGHVELQTIRLQGNDIDNVDFIVQLPYLFILDISGNRVREIPDLGERQVFFQFSARDNELTRFPVFSAPILTTLDLHGNNLTSTEGLPDAPGLQLLDLGGNAITDLSRVADYPGLYSLDLSDNPVPDLEMVRNLAVLQRLWIDRMGITDLGPLADLTNLDLLSASGNEITDLSPLAGTVWLADVRLDDNRISDLSPLRDNEYMLTLSLNRNLIEDLSPLSSWHNLSELHLDENRITDLSPLPVQEYLTVFSATGQRIPGRPLFVPETADAFTTVDARLVLGLEGEPIALQPSGDAAGQLVWDAVDAADDHLTAAFASGDGRFSGEIVYPVSSAQFTSALDVDAVAGEVESIPLSVSAGFAVTRFELTGAPTWARIDASNSLVIEAPTSGTWRIGLVAVDAWGNRIEAPMEITASESIPATGVGGDGSAATERLAGTGSAAPLIGGTVAALLVVLGFSMAWLRRRRVRPTA